MGDEALTVNGQKAASDHVGLSLALGGISSATPVLALVPVSHASHLEIINKDAGCYAVTHPGNYFAFRSLCGLWPVARGLGSPAVTHAYHSEIFTGVPNTPGFGVVGWKKDAGCYAVTHSRNVHQKSVSQEPIAKSQ